MISKCKLHPSEPAIGKCSVCSRPVCKRCSTLVERKLTCRGCVGRKPVGSAEDAEETERQERLDRSREERRKGR